MASLPKDRIIAGGGTIIFHIIVALVLIMAYLQYSGLPTEDRWPPEDTSEILFGGEYVMLGDVQQPTSRSDNSPAPESQAEAATVEGLDLTNESAMMPEPVSQTVVASEQESPMKVEKKPAPEKTGPTAAELAERERQRIEKEQAQRQKAINNRMKSGFSKSASGEGKAGSPNGNSSTGALSGAPGHNLAGRTAQSWGKPKSTLSGTVQVRVRVNRQGYVVGTPTYIGGSGPASGSMAVRNSCIEASSQSRFSVNLDAASEQVGIITWRFE